MLTLPNEIIADFSPICTSLQLSNLGYGPDFGDWCDSDTRETNGDSNFTDNGFAGRRPISELPPGAERAKWSGLELSKILLGLLVAAFAVLDVPLMIGADDTIERRKGKKIKEKGVFRDPVRSSHKYTVHVFGLRWMSMMLIVPVPWSSRVWALPFLTVLAPSEKTNAANGKRHKTTIDWIMQMISIVRRWQPQKKIVLVTDGGLCALKLGLRCCRLANPVTWVSRLRLDVALYAEPEPQPDGKPGPKPKKGPRQPSLNDTSCPPANRLADPDRHLVCWQA